MVLMVLQVSAVQKDQPVIQVSAVRKAIQVTRVQKDQQVTQVSAAVWVQKELQDKLATELLSGKIMDGSVVPVTVHDGQLAVGDEAVRPKTAVMH